MGSGNRLAWGFLPSADPRGRACRPDQESAARYEPTTGRKEAHATSRSATRNRSADLGPRPSPTGTAVSWHAYAPMRTWTRMKNLP